MGDLNHVSNTIYYKYLGLIKNGLVDKQLLFLKIESKYLFTLITMDECKNAFLSSILEDYLNSKKADGARKVYLVI